MTWIDAITDLGYLDALAGADPTEERVSKPTGPHRPPTGFSSWARYIAHCDRINELEMWGPQGRPAVARLA